MIKAIETNYKGYRFRSRLEARWAVFFDGMGIRWEYEKEGYLLPSGPYLPDFWLSQPLNWATCEDCWVEVKGSCPTDDEIYKGVMLADLTKTKVVIVHGSLELGQYGLFWGCFLAIPSNPYATVHKCSIEEAFPTITWDENRFLNAFRSARSARFEHGETPGRPR